MRQLAVFFIAEIALWIAVMFQQAQAIDTSVWTTLIVGAFGFLTVALQLYNANQRAKIEAKRDLDIVAAKLAAERQAYEIKIALEKQNDDVKVQRERQASDIKTALEKQNDDMKIQRDNQTSKITAVLDKQTADMERQGEKLEVVHSLTNDAHLKQQLHIDEQNRQIAELTRALSERARTDTAVVMDRAAQRQPPPAQTEPTQVEVVNTEPLPVDVVAKPEKPPADESKA